MITASRLSQTPRRVSGRRAVLTRLAGLDASVMLAQYLVDESTDEQRQAKSAESGEAAQHGDPD